MKKPITIRQAWATYRVTGGTNPLTTDHFYLSHAVNECVRRGASEADLDAILTDFKASLPQPVTA